MQIEGGFLQKWRCMQEEGGCMQGEDRYMQEDGVGACKETAGAGRVEVGAFSEREGYIKK